MANSKTHNLVTDNKDVVVYCRVSTDEQYNSHLGLDVQLEMCKKLAEYQQLTIIGSFEENIGGKIDPLMRPVFSDAIHLAIERQAKFMIAKLDRLSRDVYHISGFLNGHMIKNCPKLIVAETPNASEFELNLRAALAQEERRLISERTKDALAILRSQGVELGKVGRETALQKKREKTKEAFEMMLELRSQRYSYQEIATKLNECGLKTSRGGMWHPPMVHSRVKNYTKGL